MNAIDILNELDRKYETDLQRIGSVIGYGNAQSILGHLWDEMLANEYGIENSSRGRMGVTVDDALPPLPKATALRRKQRRDGGYEMVPAYTAEEMKRFAHAAIDKAAGAKS